MIIFYNLHPAGVAPSVTRAWSVSDTPGMNAHSKRTPPGCLNANAEAQLRSDKHLNSYETY